MTADTTARLRRAVRFSLVVLAALAVAAGVYVIATTAPTRDSIYPKCVTYTALGVHCPGCGTGRAAHLLLTGRPLDALQANLFAPFLLPLVLAVAFIQLLRWAADAPPSDRPPVRARWIYLLASAFALYMVLRNIPIEPFSRLAPKEIEATERP